MSTSAGRTGADERGSWFLFTRIPEVRLTRRHQVLLFSTSDVGVIQIRRAEVAIFANSEARTTARSRCAREDEVAHRCLVNASVPRREEPRAWPPVQLHPRRLEERPYGRKA